MKEAIEKIEWQIDLIRKEKKHFNIQDREYLEFTTIQQNYMQAIKSIVELREREERLWKIVDHKRSLEGVSTDNTEDDISTKVLENLSKGDWSSSINNNTI